MGIEERIAYLRQQAKIKPRKKWYQKWWVILLLLFLAGLIMLGIETGRYIVDLAEQMDVEQIKANQTAQNVINNSNQKLIEGLNNYWTGTSTPKVTIVEFSDFVCPYCQNSFSTISEIKSKYKNDVKIIYRDFIGHDNSLNLALAGRCAGEQNNFWLMHDRIFSTSEPENLTPEKVIGYATQIGLDTKKFTDCLNSQKYLNLIRKDATDAASLGVTKTPTWFINGEKIEGEIPINLFEQYIKKLLNIN